LLLGCYHVGGNPARRQDRRIKMQGMSYSTGKPAADYVRAVWRLTSDAAIRRAESATSFAVATLRADTLGVTRGVGPLAEEAQRAVARDTEAERLATAYFGRIKLARKLGWDDHALWQEAVAFYGIDPNHVPKDMLP
jgi:hypothetical protein